VGTVKIVTDSTAYIPEEWFNEFKDLISVVPLTVFFNKDSLEDGLQRQGDFLKKLKESPELPTTSQPSPAAFEAVFQDLKAQGHDILGIFISKKLSGTMVSAETAAKAVGASGIHLFDSESTAAGLALLVRKTALYINKGMAIEDIISELQRDIAEVHVAFVPSTLEYLKKGGRIGGAGALLGAMLKIKPVLGLKKEVMVLDKVRTFKKAVSSMITEITPSYTGPLGIIHIADKEAAAGLKEHLAEFAPQAEIMILEAGPVLGTHAGPGALGIAYFKQSKN